MVKAKKLLTASLLLGTLVAVAGCVGAPTTPDDKKASAEVVEVKAGGQLVYAADQEPTGFNSNNSKNIGASVINIVESIYPSVFKSAPDFSVNLNTDLMISAEQTQSDPQVVVYKIKPEAKWSDGEPIDVDDFEYLWRHRNGSTPEYDVASTNGYDLISDVSGSDDGKTVTVQFSERFTEWQKLFSTIEGGGILPAHYMETLGDDVTAWNSGLDESLPISGGPFQIESFKRGDNLTLVRNDAYYGSKAHLDSIVFRFVTNSDTQLTALQSGEVGLIYPQPQLDAVLTVQNIPSVTSEITFGLSFEQLTLNTKNEFLKDVAVRQAIAIALNRNDLVAKTVGQFSPKATVLGNRLWLTGQEQYEDHSLDDMADGDGDIEKAKKVLEAAGFALGSDGYFARDGKQLQLRFSTTAGNALREQTGVLLQSQLKEAGINITIANAAAATLIGESLPQGNFDIAQFAWVGTPFPIAASQPIYTCDGGSNFGEYCNETVDQLFADAQSELDPLKAAEIVNQIDAILWEDMASVPLYQKPTFIAFNSKYGNIHDNSSKEGPFYNAGQWGELK